MVAAQRVLSRLLEVQKLEAQAQRHVGESDAMATRTAMARCLILRNRSLPDAIGLLGQARRHLWRLREADAAGVQLAKRRVWREWGRVVQAGRWWRRLASRGLRLLNFLDAFRVGRCGEKERGAEAAGSPLARPKGGPALPPSRPPSLPP